MPRRHDTRSSRPLNSVINFESYRSVEPIKSRTDVYTTGEAGGGKVEKIANSSENDENRKANFIDDGKSLQTKESKTD